MQKRLRARLLSTLECQLIQASSRATDNPFGGVEWFVASNFRAEVRIARG